MGDAADRDDQRPCHHLTCPVGDTTNEETARAIDEEVRQIVERIYARVRGLLGKQKDTLLRAAAVLKERETLDGDELKALLPAAPAVS